jgi:hypothetical protein
MSWEHHVLKMNPLVPAQHRGTTQKMAGYINKGLLWFYLSIKRRYETPNRMKRWQTRVHDSPSVSTSGYTSSGPGLQGIHILTKNIWVLHSAKDHFELLLPTHKAPQSGRIKNFLFAEGIVQLLPAKPTGLLIKPAKGKPSHKGISITIHTG